MADPAHPSIHPNVFTIPAHRAFADALAAGLIRTFGDGPTGLARGTILVPRSRAVRAIQDAFVRLAGGGLLMPRLVPIGDPEIDETLGNALDPMGAAEPVPAAIDPLERTMRLANLVQQVRAAQGAPVEAGEALRLARDLGAALDQLHIEEIAPRDLIEAIPGDLQEHWQSSLDQLEIILSKWPAELQKIGRIDLAERRNILLNRVADRWRDNPPDHFVVAAGISTTAPAVAAVLRSVSRLENGMVVLSALDIDMPDEEWNALGPFEPDPQTGHRRRSIETHPQYALKLLLDRMGVARSEVRRWRWGGGHDAPAVRTRAISNAMAPAAFTGKWNALAPRERRLTGVRALECATSSEEAQVIALVLRETIEEPGRTAALVTPDRMLARRVSAHLRRWGIMADDSAGRPLSELPSGTLLLALAEAAAERFAPVPLLALLKHPLVRFGEGRAEWLSAVRRLDLLLRGPRPRPGLAAVTAHIADRLADAREGKRGQIAETLDWWKSVVAQLEPLEQAASRQGDIPSLVAAIRETASLLTDQAVWAGPNGRPAAEFVAQLEERGAHGPATVGMAELPEILRQLMAAIPVYPPQGGHPRIHIWGLLEARLQQTDLMVLGGLSEGVWPGLPSPDPWLAPKVRADLGLPGLEHRIGLAAHDLSAALGGQRVLVTRSRRDAGAPAVASRFWLRLEAMTGGMTRWPQLKAWAKAIDRPEVVRPAERPAPAPPVADRPRRISVTDVDRLKADPFALYAKAMLRLSSLDAVDSDPSPAWRGSAVHDVLEAWFKEDNCDPDKLVARAERLLDDHDAHPLMRAMWRPRLIAPIEWIAERVREDRAAGRTPIAAECDGVIDVPNIELKGKADRIDREADGNLAIVDYKTGQPPKTKAVEAGYAMQLGLLGMLADRGAFRGVEGISAAFEYWSLAKMGDSFGYVRTPFRKGADMTPDNFVAHAEATFREAADHWLTGEAPFTAKLHPEYAPYADYDQLMRLEEWYGRGGGEGDNG
ncbi:MAG: double-strand break repair protein AddB [Parasphingopyxis sp.]|uniref:double-strand break repair protein AddB n=1 Tax=Parasphingopyxis sp. TaxID=1920299 RepID=UPI0032ED7922